MAPPLFTGIQPEVLTSNVAFTITGTNLRNIETIIFEIETQIIVIKDIKINFLGTSIKGITPNLEIGGGTVHGSISPNIFTNKIMIMVQVPYPIVSTALISGIKSLEHMPLYTNLHAILIDKKTDFTYKVNYLKQSFGISLEDATNLYNEFNVIKRKTVLKINSNIPNNNFFSNSTSNLNNNFFSNNNIKSPTKSNNNSPSVNISNNASPTNPISSPNNSSHLNLLSKINKINLLNNILDTDEDKTDVFFSYEWGIQEQVMKLNSNFKERGFRTWFDMERMSEYITEQMQAGIDNSSIVIVCLTKAYAIKASGNGEKRQKESIYLEYSYATLTKGSSRMIVVVFEDEMMNILNWEKVTFVMGHKFFIPMRASKSTEMDANIPKLINAIANMGVRPQDVLSAHINNHGDTPDDNLDSDIDKALNIKNEELSLLQFISRMNYVWILIDKEKIIRQKARLYDDAILLNNLNIEIEKIITQEHKIVQEHGKIILRCENQLVLFEALENRALNNEDLLLAKQMYNNYSVLLTKLDKLRKMSSSEQEFTLIFENKLDNITEHIFKLVHNDDKSFCSLLCDMGLPSYITDILYKLCSNFIEFIFKNVKITTDLIQRQFYKYNFEKSILSGLDLYKTSFTECNCNFLNCQNANLKKVLFDRCELTNSDFSNITSSKDLTFKKCRGSNINFSNSILSSAKFIECDFSDSNFEKTDLQQAQFLNCNLNNINFSKSNILYTDIRTSILKNCNLSYTTLTNRNFTSMDFRGFIMSNCDLSYSILDKANFNNVDLSNSNLKFVSKAATSFYSSNLNGVLF